VNFPCWIPGVGRRKNSSTISHILRIEVVFLSEKKGKSTALRVPLPGRYMVLCSNSLKILVRSKNKHFNKKE
jgi:hypothetical protein